MNMAQALQAQEAFAARNPGFAPMTPLQRRIWWVIGRHAGYWVTATLSFTKPKEFVFILTDAVGDNAAAWEVFNDQNSK